jgi:hypothetical protein
MHELHMNGLEMKFKPLTISERLVTVFALDSLLEQRARDAKQTQLDAQATAAAAAEAEEQERRDAEARKSKKAAVPYEYAPPAKTSKDVEPLIAHGKDAVEEYEAERRATPNDILVPRDSLTREVRRDAHRRQRGRSSLFAV